MNASKLVGVVFSRRDAMPATPGHMPAGLASVAATPASARPGFGRGGAPSSRRLRAALAVLAFAVAALLLTAGPALAQVKPAVTINPNPTGAYTTAEVSGTINPEGGSGFGISWLFEYSTEPTNPSSWVQSTSSWVEEFNPPYLGPPQSESTTPVTVGETMEGLRPDTTYYIRLNSYQYPEPEAVITGAPYPSFTTKHINLPKATFNPVTDITKSTAHFSGTAETNAPAGPLTPEEKAAYKTEWKVECSPECTTLPGASGVVEGDATSQAISLDPIRLETNTFYELKLTATNAAGTTIATQSFQTPFILPGVTATPGGSAGKGSFNIGGLVTPYNSKISNCHFEYGPTTEYVYSAPCSPDPVGRNMVESLSLEYNPAEHPNETFRIAFRGQTTEAMALGAEASVVEQELKALSTIGPEGVSRVEHEFGFFTSVYVVEFNGPLASANVSPLRGLTGTETINSPGGNFAGTVIKGGNNTPVLVEAHLTGLTPGATYHYQISATNSLGTVSSGDQTFVPPLAANEAACPNEAERTENSSTALPECRAYELVTSAFKASTAAELFGIASEGDAIGYDSRAANIANSGQGTIIYNDYVAVRRNSGWETLPDLNGPLGSLYAPPNSFEGTLQPAHYARNLLSAIYYVPVKFNKTELQAYLRRPDGSFARIMEGNPNVAGFDYYAGANTDFSRTIWDGSGGAGFRWGPGVYEFEGTGNGHEPARRLDVDNAGNPISECSNNIQAGSAQSVYVSPDASVVYMTISGSEGCLVGPPANEIWARVNRTTSYDATASHCTRTASDPGGACYEPLNPSSTEPVVHFEGATTNGSRVFFTTKQQLVNGDTNQDTDLYAYTLPTTSNPNPSLIDVSGAGPDAKVQSVVAFAKEGDGSRVYFTAEGVLASNHDAFDEPPRAGDQNLYVWQQDASHPEGETKFIGNLQNSLYYRSQATPDGRYLVFPAYAPMVPTDTDNGLDVYRYDAVTGELIRVSTDSSGVGGNGDGFNAELSGNAISNDGQEIVFTTNEALSPNDGNGATDIYIWKNGHTSLISTGAVGGGASVGYIDGSGQDVYFTTTQALTADDVDNVADVYDARIDGGFSFVEKTQCSGENCQPPPSSNPVVPAPATENSTGSGNHQRGTVSIRALSPPEEAKLAAGAHVGLKLKVSGPGKISVTGTARVGRRQSQVLASKFAAVQAGDVSVPISLTQAAREQLQSSGSLKVRLTVSFADAPPNASTVALKAAQARPGSSKRKGG